MNDLVIRGGRVLSMDPEVGDFEKADVLIRDGKIVEISPTISTDAEEIQADGNIVMPGFVDTHTHMWNSLWRTVDYSYIRVHDTLGAHYKPEDSYNGVRLTATDMISSGVTTVNAWEHNCRTAEHVDAELQAIRDIGIRSLYSYGYHHDMPADAITDFTDISRARDQWADDRITVGFASRCDGYDGSPPHPFPAATPAVRDLEWATARDLGLRITHHVSTPDARPENYVRLAGPDTVFAHGYQWGSETWKAFADRGAAMSMSPFSSTGYRVAAPFTQMTDSGVVVSLSFDHLGGPGAADMFRTMQMGQNLSKFVGDTVSARQMLDFATIGGARALGLGDVTGSLTPGKAADVILVKTDAVGMSPLVDSHRALVNSGRPDYVSTVLVGGRVLKREGRLVDVAESEVREKATTSIRRLFKESGLSEMGGPK